MVQLHCQKKSKVKFQKLVLTYTTRKSCYFHEIQVYFYDYCVGYSCQAITRFIKLESSN